MRLGRRLVTGVAEHPPAPEPRQPEHPEPEAVGTLDATVRTEPAPAELTAER